MDFKTYREQTKGNLPSSLEVNQVLKSITRVEPYTFEYEGNTINAIKIFADGKEFKTSSAVIIEQLTEFFNTTQGEALTNVKVVTPKGKRYLTLESA
jgi:hypothetical protein